VLPESEILTADEQVIGRYQAEIARWGNGRWASTIPPIYMLITNQRLILQAQTRKRYEPASIPARAIRAVDDLKAHRQGIVVTLKNDQRIHLFISHGHDQSLINQIRAIADLPPVKTYNLPLNVDGLQKLIEFVETIK
jgi:hypothetical protein